MARTILLPLLLFSVFLLQDAPSSAAPVSFFENCKLPSGSVKRRGSTWTFRLRHRDVGGCSMDPTARHSAPYWERAEVRSDYLKKGETYEVTFEFNFDPETSSSQRTSFFQIHTHNKACPGCINAFALKAKEDRIGASVLFQNGVHLEYVFDVTRASVAGKWTRVRIVAGTASGNNPILVEIDGKEVLRKETLFVPAKGRPYFKMGLYRPGSEAKLPTDRVSIRNVEANIVR